MNSTADHFYPIGDHLNLAWRTVNPIADRFNLAWRTVNPIADRFNLAWRTVNPIGGHFNRVWRTVNPIGGRLKANQERVAACAATRSAPISRPELSRRAC
jgi:hypothetical protein